MIYKKVVILGGGGVGKSCITIQLTSNVFVAQYDPTIEHTYRKEMTVDNQSVMLEILDTAGQEDFTILRDTYIRGGEGFVLVYSITSPESFEQIPSLLQQIMEVKDVEANFPTVLVGNKCDLEQERKVSRRQGEELARTNRIQFYESSAKLRVNIDEVFEQLVREIAAYSSRPSAPEPHTFGQLQKKSKPCIIL
eukprot:TRINITY_DN8300_c0_g1_i1.p1 TRINITY_DN8300_c0_g1~~TRINITY_DN8300_c0_g1_i1.p1  ORF type:complete len:194 (-),score=24.68 TRINITY_DN8300_c0_g1_i1:213-794(-)